MKNGPISIADVCEGNVAEMSWQERAIWQQRQSPIPPALKSNVLAWWGAGWQKDIFLPFTQAEWETDGTGLTSIFGTGNTPTATEFTAIKAADVAAGNPQTWTGSLNKNVNPAGKYYAYDASGNGRIAKLYNMAYTAASGPQAGPPKHWLLDGTDDYMKRVFSPDAIPANTSYSAMAEFSVPNLSGYKFIVIPSNGTSKSISCYLNSDILTADFGDSVTGQQTVVTTKIKANTHYIVTVTYDQTDKKGRLYVNGLLIATTAALTNGIAKVTHFKSGINPGDSSYSAQRIGVLSLFNRKLTDAEISDLYNRSRSYFGMLMRRTANMHDYAVAMRARTTAPEAMDAFGFSVPTGASYNVVSNKTVYVDASRPDDTGDGLTPATAKKTITAGLAVAESAQNNILYVKAGIYAEIVSISRAGLVVIGWGGYALVDGLYRADSDSSSNIDVSAAGVVTVNLGVINAPANGFKLNTGANNCIVVDGYASDCEGPGFKVENATSGNLFVNCYSGYNYDYTNDGQHADGFAINGTNTVYINCVAEHNSDDGFDTYSGYNNLFYHCTALYSGTADGCRNRDHGAHVLGGDGNGFKIGPGDSARDGTVDGVCTSAAVGCLAAYCTQAGLDSNNSTDATFVHCTSMFNGKNVNVYASTFGGGGAGHKVYNCISYAGAQSDNLVAAADDQGNSWNVGVTVTNADFVSVDPTDANFGVLATSSAMKNRGDLYADSYTLENNSDVGWSTMPAYEPSISYF